MTTPGKFDYSSPYANELKQYPSQSEDYISLDMGGCVQQNHCSSSSEKTPAHHGSNYYKQNYRNSNSKANRRNLFNSHGMQNNRQSFNQQQRYGQRFNNEGGHQQQNITNSNQKRQQQKHNDKKDVNHVASYLHSSMTEDPWYELIQRAEALEKSKISLCETSASNKSPPQDKDSNPSSDDNIEDSVESD